MVTQAKVSVSILELNKTSNKMTTLLSMFISLLLHTLVIGLSCLSPMKSDLSFRKGEIAMELLEQKVETGIQKSTTSDGAIVNGSDAHKSKSSAPAGIQSGSSLGIIAPEYPETSRLRGEEGEVIVAFTLDSEGKLVTKNIVLTSGYEAMDRSAVLAIESHYESSQSNKIENEYKVRFKFKLSK